MASTVARATQWRQQAALRSCAADRAPLRQFARERQTRVRRARGRQTAIFQRREIVSERRQHHPTIHFLGLAAVEIHTSQASMIRQERTEIVGGRGGVHDGAVETAGTFSRREHVPDGNPMSFENGNASGVRYRQIFTEHGSQDLPERVVWMAVILLQLEGAATWERAQDQHFRVATGDGRKAFVHAAVTFGQRSGWTQDLDLSGTQPHIQPSARPGTGYAPAALPA